MHLGWLLLEVCSLRWAHSPFPQAHRHQALPVHRLQPELFSLWPPVPAPPAPWHHVSSTVLTRRAALVSFLCVCWSHDHLFLFDFSLPLGWDWSSSLSQVDETGGKDSWFPMVAPHIPSSHLRIGWIKSVAPMVTDGTLFYNNKTGIQLKAVNKHMLLFSCFSLLLF